MTEKPLLRAIARSAAVGLACGLAWGVTARIWMRMISNDPEFTWAGTLMIVGFSGWLGVGVGLSYAVRVARRRRWLAIFGLPGLMLFASPGMAFLPAFLFGGALWNSARRPLLRALDITLGALAVTVPTGVMAMATANEPGLPPTLYEMFEFVTGFALLSLLLAYGGSYVWRKPSASAAMVVSEPCPVCTTVSPGSVNSRKRIDSTMVS